MEFASSKLRHPGSPILMNLREQFASSLIASRFARWGWTAAPPIHWTRDASRDIKPGCQDHHPEAIGPRPPPSGPRPTGRGARQLPWMCRRSRRWLSDTVGPPIGAVDCSGGLTRCRCLSGCSDAKHQLMRSSRRQSSLLPHAGVTVLSAVGKVLPQHLVRSTGTALSTTGSTEYVPPNGHPRSCLRPRPGGQLSPALAQSRECARHAPCQSPIAWQSLVPNPSIPKLS